MNLGDGGRQFDSPVTYRGYQIYISTRQVAGVWLGTFSVWRAEACDSLTASGGGQELGAYASRARAYDTTCAAAFRYVDSFLGAS